MVMVSTVGSGIIFLWSQQQHDRFLEVSVEQNNFIFGHIFLLSVDITLKVVTFLGGKEKMSERENFLLILLSKEEVSQKQSFPPIFFSQLPIEIVIFEEAC